MLSGALYWAEASSCSTPAQLQNNCISSLLLVVFEKRVLFSTSGLYQHQLWNPRFALDTSLSQEGKHGVAGVDVGKTRENHKGKECDGHKWDWFTPSRLQGMEVIGLCNLSSVKVQCFLLRASEESFDSRDYKVMVLWRKVELDCCIWQDKEQLS